MDFLKGIGRWWRTICHTGAWHWFSQASIVLLIAVTLASAQGLFELFDPQKTLLESLSQWNFTWLLAFGLTMVGVLITSHFFHEFVLGRRAREESLQTALKMTVTSFDLGPDANARVAVYVAEPRKKESKILYQEFPYVYAHRHVKNYGLGEAGINESAGIVGRVFRTHEDLAVHVPNQDRKKFVDLLCGQWSFSRAIAESIDADRPSIMAIRFCCPQIRDKPLVEGVLFFDAAGENPAFDEAMILRVVREQYPVIVEIRGKLYNRSRVNS